MMFHDLPEVTIAGPMALQSQSVPLVGSFAQKIVPILHYNLGRSYRRYWHYRHGASASGIADYR